MSRLRETRHEIRDARAFGRVAVMLGGSSSERQVSLETGNAVLAALCSRGVDAHAWDPAERRLKELAGAGFDRERVRRELAEHQLKQLRLASAGSDSRGPPRPGSPRSAGRSPHRGV